MTCLELGKGGGRPPARQGRAVFLEQSGSGKRMEPRGTVPRRLTGTARAGVQRTQADALNLPGRKFAETYFRCSVGWDGAGGRNRRSVCTELTLTWEREGRRRGADRRATDRNPGWGSPNLLAGRGWGRTGPPTKGTSAECFSFHHDAEARVAIKRPGDTCETPKHKLWAPCSQKQVDGDASFRNL